MRCLSFVFMCTFGALVAGCQPGQLPPPVVPPVSPPVSQFEARPYLSQSLETVGPVDALAYYAALKILTSDELTLEHQRLLKAIDSTDNRLAHVQRVLLACLPGQTLVDLSLAVKSLEAVRHDADLHRELGDLFVLLNDQLTASAMIRSQDQDCAQSLLTARKKTKAQSGDLAICRRERDQLASKLQKLQDIERGLLDRQRQK